jgi:anti-sigma factor RsiW
MHCNEIADLLNPSVDGELDLDRSLAVERHLQECLACAGAGSAWASIVFRHNSGGLPEKARRRCARPGHWSIRGGGAGGWRDGSSPCEFSLGEPAGRSP